MFIDSNGTRRLAPYFKLTTINKYLRYTGWQVYIGYGDNEPSRIGLVFLGRNNDRHEN